MLWIGYLLAVILVTEFYDYYWLRERAGWTRLFSVMFVLAVALTWPFFVPAHLPIVRFIVAMMVFNKIVKSVELAYHRVYDPSMVASFGRYLFWSLNFPDTKWPENEEQAKNNREDGRRRLLRGLSKLVIFAGLLALSTALPGIHSYYWLKMLWVVFVAYFAFSMTADFLLGFAMQTGIYFIEMFDAPLIARSPREFWGRRWNLYFREVSHRNVFLPLGGSKHPLIAVCAVFAVSALLHEYLIVVSVGWKMLGYMSAFFVVHCFATIGQTMVSHWTGKKKLLPRPLAILVNMAWMVATAPLLMEPLLLVLPCHEWHLW
jgi:D-alanyl-lipoteichoic acid acyltransferase DltB (MBOAT superfamily)